MTAKHSPLNVCEGILRRILAEICNEAFFIDVERYEGITTLKVRVHPKDMPFVIGKGGTIAEAIISLFRTLSLRLGDNIGVRLIDPPTREDGARRFVGKPKWNSQTIYSLASEISEVFFTKPIAVNIIDADGQEFHERFGSILRIETDPMEKQTTVREGIKILTPIFDVIGKANGRRIKVSIGTAES